MKALFTVFFYCNDVVHHELLPQNRTVNKEYYLEFIRRLHEAIRQKHTELWKNQSWILHHVNDPLAHRSLCVSLAKNKTVIIHQPLYSSGLATADFLLFPKLKASNKKGKQFATIEEI